MCSQQMKHALLQGGFSHGLLEICSDGTLAAAGAYPNLSKLPLSSGIITAMLDLFRSLEERLLRQGVRHSPDEADALLAADFFEFGRSGAVWNRQQTIEGLMQEPLIEHSMRDVTTRLLSESVVLVTYRSVRRDPVSSKEWHALRSSVWKLIDGRWQMIFHQGTPTQPNP
jgi:hypothetical protein